MKKTIGILIIAFTLTSYAYSESFYKKFTKVFDKTVDVVETVTEKVVEDSKESLKDFEEDINAPKEKQSTFVRILNFLDNVDVTENLKKSGACYNGPVEEVPEGIF